MFQRVVSAQSPALADSAQSGKNERPDKPKFIVEADQRFFFFRDATPPKLRHPVNVWGLRAGLLLPVNVKVGVGFYFTRQSVNDSWAGYRVTYRRLYYGTLYVEPYFYRREYWELSAPLEVGFGTASYDLVSTDTEQSDRRKSVAVPLSAGVSVSTKFPALWGFKPLRWFGINFIGGYRYTLQPRVPTRPGTLNGVYYSVSPAVFLDRIYDDVSAWRKNRRGPKK